MKKVLFQGDSVTDARRNREDDNYAGCGYPTVAGGMLQCKYPNSFEFLNRGISGNRSVDMYARIKDDCINLAPDYISILIGVNDLWHEISKKNGVDVAKYKKIYSMFIEETKSALPNVGFIIMTPFVTHGTATDEAWDAFSSVADYARAATEVGKEFGIPVISLQSLFDEAIKLAPAEHWTIDGVHPTAAGHALIAEQWLRIFEENYIK